MTRGREQGFESRPLSALRGRVGRLLVLLPDQLHLDYLSAAGLERAGDAVLQMELSDDFTHVPSHKQRTALVLSAMRHFAREIAGAGWRAAYVRVEDRRNDGDFGSQLVRACDALDPQRLVALRPGDFRTLKALRQAAAGLGLELELLEDPHFLVEPAAFASWAEGRKVLVMEHFYRWSRRRLGVLLCEDGKPEGGSWNYDADNRKPLGKDRPALPERRAFPPDAITREVLALVSRRFPDAPGSLDSFAWAVSREQALAALEHFVDRGLKHFGDYQDAMQRGEAWLFHSLLSPALNLKLLDPRECVERAEAAYREGRAPLNSVEGFIRQLIGWREFIRGIYWREGESYARRNHLDEEGRLPEFYWTGETEMQCARDALGQVLEHGYGHHIQRLMVTGNLALVAGVHPRRVSDWYLGMYVDAMDWVTLPNTLGMVMYGDGGLVGSKPYAASGRYIERMSDHCSECRFRPGERVGETACPVTVLYWDFLARHRERLAANRRMRFAYANLDRLPAGELAEVGRRAAALRRGWGVMG
ncbi:MAG: cryptochrome/photolyase family protein [Acidobacteriota bacterium]|nr:cryptochrome/photolyase family protein [Acidobacteriota bacterium]MDH3523680.1 cryptochrome/photolyase family protein [Acidobacteriota bacterium]